MEKSTGKTSRSTVPASARPARIQSVGRIKALLDAMAGGGWVSLKDLAVATKLAKTTAFNLVSALVDTGLAEHDGKAGAYRLSLQHVIYGKAVERRLDVVSIAMSHLIRLCATTRETVNLALPGPTDAMIVESLEGSQTLRVTSYSGTRAAYHSTACGRALLAHRPHSFRSLIYSLGPLAKLTDSTVTDSAELELILERCRNIGWTTEFEENEMGGACVAAPIFGPSGEPVASVSIAGPAARFDPEAMQRLGKLLVASLAEITGELARASAVPAQRGGRTR